ncbi:conserved hypothetical protein, partial [Trichinella spiralis]|uniref:hypothetical protein n=1 Tax=Trichinella spiralis TaxID=6334 RepID=UPI0001EFB67F
DKKGCGGAVWTNLDVTTVIKRNDHIESCPVDEHLAYKMEKRAVLAQRSAEETKPIPAIYDEEASVASAEPSTFGHFPLFRRVRAAMYGHRAKRFPRLPEHRHDLVIPDQFKTTKSGEDFLLCQSIYWYLRRVPTLDCWQPVEPGAWMVHSRLYISGINSYLPSMPLWRASWCQQSIVYVRVKTLERTGIFFKL